MSISGSVSYNPIVTTIVGRSLNLLGVLSAGASLPAEDYSTGLDMLNMMVKYWQTKSIGLWTTQECILFLTSDQNIYRLGGSSPAKASTVWNVTTLVDTSGVGDTTVELTATSDPLDLNDTMVVGDAIGFVKTNDTIFWTTISAIASTIVTLTDALPALVEEGCQVYTYRGTLSAPLEISNVRYRDSNHNEVQVAEASRMDYDAISTKRTVSTLPTQYYLEIQNGVSLLKLWPAPDSVSGTLRFSAITRIDDFVNTADTADLPQEWILPIVYNLAMYLAPIYNKELKVNTPGPGSIASIAKESLADAKKWDAETAPTFIRPKI